MKRHKKEILLILLFSLILLILSLLLKESKLLLQKDKNQIIDAQSVKLDRKLNYTLKSFNKPIKNPFKKVKLYPGTNFKINMSEKLFSYYTAPKQQFKDQDLHNKFKKAHLQIESNPEINIQIRGRGAGSLSINNRKSLFLKLSRKLKLDRYKTKIIFLMNLGHDPYGYETRFSYSMLKDLGLFFMYNQYAVVYLNNVSQGLYLLIERPEDAIKRNVKRTVSIYRTRRFISEDCRLRRAQGEVWIDDYKTIHTVPGSEAVANIKKLKSISDIEDNDLQAKSFEKVIDMKMYMRWLIFNALVENGDSVDELFLYEVRDKEKLKGKFKIHPWDYDDIQSDPSHLSCTHEDKLMWAAESNLAFQIQNNPILYLQYRNLMEEILTEIITEKHITNTISELHKTLDSIDTGLPEKEQSNTKLERKIAIKKFTERILERRKKLLKICSDIELVQK